MGDRETLKNVTSLPWCAITPDLEVTVRLDVLEGIDGRMLLHGLQGFQGRRIHVARADHLKPNRDFLAERYALFRRAG